MLDRLKRDDCRKFSRTFRRTAETFADGKNSGSGAVPRNKGLEHAQGKYICFVDADDLLTSAALETLYDFAEDYQADVVSMNVGLICDAEPVPKKFGERKWIPEFSDKIFLDDDFEERLKKFFDSQYELVPWSRFSRRDFLIDNGITFPHVKIGEDTLWTIQVICLAKNLLRVPNRLYIYRSVKNSWSRAARSPEDEIKFWLDPLVNGLDFLDEFMDGIIFFTQNPHCRFEVTNFFVKMQGARRLGAFKKLEPEELYKIFHAALIAKSFTAKNFWR